MLIFGEGGEPGEKPSKQEGESITNSAHMTQSPGIEPRPQWREVRAHAHYHTTHASHGVHTPPPTEEQSSVILTPHLSKHSFTSPAIRIYIFFNGVTYMFIFLKISKLFQFIFKLCVCFL
jgi:hypothetical protein